jgi:hypothetical protein
MCGILGVISKYDNGFFKQTEESFYQMLYADAVRGWDSTGVIAVEKDGEFHIAKEASEPAFFIPQFREGTVGKAMYNRGKVMIGHNRKKTVGDIKDETAHPFVVDNTFAMVHNGTLFSHKELANVDVDSEALAIVFKKALDEEEPLKALEEVLGKVFGAYATVMYDQKRDRVHFLRNKERPLFLIEAPNAWYFASEAMMATWILCRNDYKFSDLKVTLLDEHKLYTYNLLKNTMHEDQLTPKKATPVPTHGQTHSASATGFGINQGSRLSKSALKFFKRKWLGERISFWVDDYIEKNYPKTEASGETEMLLFAHVDEIAQVHSISSECDLKQCGLKESGDIFDTRWTAVITDIEYDERNQSVRIETGLAKPVLSSIPIKQTDAVAITSKAVFDISLKDKSLLVLQREYEKYKTEGHLTPWMRDSYEAAIKERSEHSAKIYEKYHRLGLEAALDAAKKEGREIMHEQRGAQHVWFDDKTNEVIYESPIVIH